MTTEPSYLPRRRQLYRLNRYPAPCPHCGEHRKLYPTGFCLQCSNTFGLRGCKSCGSIRLLDANFHPNDHVCRVCQNKRKRESA